MLVAVFYKFLIFQIFCVNVVFSGTPIPPQDERSFLSKYWWAILIGLMLISVHFTPNFSVLQHKITIFVYVRTFS